MKWRFTTIAQIKISQLLFDQDNPRYLHLNSQAEALQKIILDQGNDLVALASSIADHGLNPTQTLIVMKHGQRAGYYIVLEGNRRLAALKILTSPSLLDNFTVPKRQKQEYKILHKRFVGNFVEAAECWEAPSRDATRPWLLLRHTGLNEGAGVSPWTSPQIARFVTGTSLIDSVRKLLEEQNMLSGETRDNLDRVRISNLTRLLEDVTVGRIVGARYYGNQREFKTFIDEQEVVKPLKRILDDLAARRINLKDVRNKPDRLNYLSSFSVDELPSGVDMSLFGNAAPPNTSKVASGSGAVSGGDKPSTVPASAAGSNKDKSTTRDQSAEVENKSELEQDSTSANKKTAVKEEKSVSQRKSLIPRNFKLSIKIPRINDIYKELKTIHVDQSPNAVSVLFRVFLETSTDHYLTTNSLIPAGTTLRDMRMVAKWRLAVKHMKDHVLVSKEHLSAAAKVDSAPYHLLSIKTFHAYVHDANFHPIASELKYAWERLQPVVEQLWK